ncbi:hypothetical protein [Halospeciosus flavus]|uniref:Uncharacterized protein n=1 Tax=Halospeciosus flavus TaxID=3032283 RepID=A0ABD5Z4I9_9EURY|nr:hypothetical protein [Halospeciosus flavus]
MNPTRRTLLRRGAVGASVAGLGGLAGCLGLGGEENPVRVQQTNIPPNSGGPLVAEVVVSNVADHPVTTTLYVTAKMEDGSLVRDREITLDAHQTDTFRVEFDVPYDEAVKGSLSMSADVRRD